MAQTGSSQAEALKNELEENSAITPEKMIMVADQGLRIAEAGNDTAATVYFLSKKAEANLMLSKYPEALELYLQSIRLCEAYGDAPALSYLYNNMANVHREIGDNELANEYYHMGLDLFIKVGDSIGIAMAYNNIGIIHMIKAEYDTGMAMWQQSLDVKLAMGAEESAAATMGNMAMYYRDVGETQKALDLLNRAMEIHSLYHNYRGQALVCDNMGELYMKLGDSVQSLFYYRQGVELSEQSHSLMQLSGAWQSLAEANYHFGKYKEAYDCILKHHFLLDSMLNEANMTELAELNAIFGNEKKEMEIARLEEQEKRQNVQKIGLGIGLGLMTMLVFVALRGYRQKKKSHDVIAKQKEQVEHKNLLIEEKNREILDSINYAKRLQDAILPPSSAINRSLRDSFVLYLPKDIVAGDFYWLHELPENNVLFAVADCTGHGVPGAMVSVVCANALDRSVKEFGLHDPAMILDKTREIVVDHFNRSETGVNDGMDISLCKWDRAVNKLHWAGANNPLLIVRNGQQIEVKPDKQPIGRYHEVNPFTNHEISLEKGDMIYLFTDGFADQFGGDKYKKLKYSPFKEYLQSIAMLDTVTQKVTLVEFFEKWKGDLEQLDDVCLIGVRV